MQKRGLIAGLFILILAVNLVGFVSAQPGIRGTAPISAAPDFLVKIGDFFKNLWDNILLPSFKFFLGEIDKVELFYAKILFLFILLTFVYLGVRMLPAMEDKKALSFFLSLAISILAIRFFTTSGFVELVLLPYSALGIAITALLPLMIFFYFVEKAVPTGIYRKIAWIFAIVVFGGLYISRFDDLGDAAYLYLATAGLCFLFIIFDGTVRKWFRKAELQRMEVNTSDEAITKLRRTLTELQQDFTSGIITEEQFKKRRSQLLKRIYALTK